MNTSMMLLMGAILLPVVCGQKTVFLMTFDAPLVLKGQVNSSWNLVSDVQEGLDIVGLYQKQRACMLPTMSSMNPVDILTLFPRREEKVLGRGGEVLSVLSDLEDKFDDVKDEVEKKKRELENAKKQVQTEIDNAVNAAINKAQQEVTSVYDDAKKTYDAAYDAAQDFATCVYCLGTMYDLFLLWECPGQPTETILMCRDVQCDQFVGCDCFPGENWRYDLGCGIGPGTLSVRVQHRADSPCSRLHTKGFVKVTCADGFIRRQFNMSVCSRCTSELDCNDHADSVTSVNDKECVCQCEAGYTGPQCDDCAEGYIKVGSNCEQCTLSGSCSSRADYVLAVNGVCQCFCHTGYAPDTTNHTNGFGCSECADGYVGDACQTHCDAEYCNFRGTPLATPTLAPPFNQTCTCECSGWYSGDSCTECGIEFGGADCNTCAPGHILEPTNCTIPTCSNCSFALHSTCTGCRGCTEGDCSYNQRDNGITTDAESRNCVCICAGQWEGDACDYCPDKYDQTTCSTCAANRDNYPLCQCTANYKGDNCSICPDKYNVSGCVDCAENRNASLNPACPCIHKYEGPQCRDCSIKYKQDTCDACAANRIGYPECKCLNRYEGPLCEECSVKYTNNCSVCATNRNQTLFPACPCSGQYQGEHCNECNPKYDQEGCNQCNTSRVEYPVCSCYAQYTEESNCTRCDDKYTDTCDGCRYVPEVLYQTGCFSCADASQVMDATGDCQPCPSGLHCDGSLYTNVLEGWWRDAEFVCEGMCHTMAQADCHPEHCAWNASLAKCVDSGDHPICGMFITPSMCHTPHCTGSNSSLGMQLAASEGTCVNGTDSVLCGVCGEDAVLSDGRCHTCRGPQTEGLIAGFSLVGAVAAALGFVHVSFPKTIKRKPLFLRAMKQMVSHLQVLATFAMLRLPWGDVLDGITNSAARVSSVGSDPAAVLCVTSDLDLGDTTLFWLCVLPFMLLLMAAVSALLFGRSVPKGEEKMVSAKKQVIELCQLCRVAWGETQCKDCMGVRCKACGKVCRAKQHDEVPIVTAEGGARVLPQKTNVFINAGVVLYFLTWPNIVKELLRPLSCTEYSTVGGGTRSVVTSDARLECGGVTMALSAMGVVFHTMFMPIALAVLFTLSREVLHEFQWVSSLGFMYTEYRRRYCWWESTVLLRKGLIMLVANTSQTPAVKVYSMVAVFLLFLSMNVMCRPYRELIQQHLESLSLITLLLTILVGEWIVHNEGTQTQAVLVRIAVVQNIVFFAVWVGVMIYAVRNHLCQGKEDSSSVEETVSEYYLSEYVPYEEDQGSEMQEVQQYIEDVESIEAPDYASDTGSSSSGLKSPTRTPSAAYSAADSLLVSSAPAIGGDPKRDRQDMYRRFNV